MEIRVNGTPKEIAALVVAIQERQEVPQTYDLKILCDGMVVQEISYINHVNR